MHFDDIDMIDLITEIIYRSCNRVLIHLMQDEYGVQMTSFHIVHPGVRYALPFLRVGSAWRQL